MTGFTGLTNEEGSSYGVEAILIEPRPADTKMLKISINRRDAAHFCPTFISLRQPTPQSVITLNQLLEGRSIELKDHLLDQTQYLRKRAGRRTAGAPSRTDQAEKVVTARR